MGSLQKFSKKGFVNKSWEGEIVMEGTKFSGANGSMRGGNVWKFSVLDANVAKTAEEAFTTFNPVAIKYCEENPLNPLWKATSSTPYIATQITVSK